MLLIADLREPLITFWKFNTVMAAGVVNGKIVVERPNQKLAGFAFCKKGEPSDLATERYHEIVKNLGRNY
jgi:hypothetical protein